MRERLHGAAARAAALLAVAGVMAGPAPASALPVAGGSPGDTGSAPAGPTSADTGAVKAPSARSDTVPPAAADTASRSGVVPALVDQIAGTTIYLRAGKRAGLAAGDTVAVARDSAGAVVGRLTVIAATAERSVTTFAGPPFAVTRGQTLYLRSGVGASALAAAGAGQGGPPGGAAAGGGAAVGRPGAGERGELGGGGAAQGAGVVPGPTATGRVSLDLDLRRSVTTFGGGDPVSTTRTFATPSLWLQTAVRDLPGGLSLDASARVSQRISSPSIVDPRTAPEIYEASLDKRFSEVPLDLRLGRFYSPYDPFGGYWDGLMLHYGSTFGGGVMAGFEPKRGNQAPQGELPKASAFLDYRSAAGASVGYDGTVSFTAMRPTTSSGLADHTFASVSQRLRLGRWYLTQDAQVDRGAAGTGWTVTRARVWASGPVTNELSVRGGVSRYRPYLYWMSDSVLISYRRDEARGGFTLRLPGAWVGADAAVDHDQGVGTGHTFSGYLGLARITPLDLGFDGSASWFTNGTTRVLTASAHFTKALGSVNARLGYDLYRSRAPQGFWIMSHAADLGLDVPLAGGFHYSILGQFRIGGGLGQTRLYTSLSKSFGP